MELKAYLLKENLGVSAFAKKADMKQPYLSLIINNKRVPSPPLALRISEATGGAVSVMELLFPDKKRERPPKS